MARTSSGRANLIHVGPIYIRSREIPGRGSYQVTQNGKAIDAGPALGQRRRRWTNAGPASIAPRKVNTPEVLPFEAGSTEVSVSGRREGGHPVRICGVLIALRWVCAVSRLVDPPESTDVSGSPAPDTLPRPVVTVDTAPPALCSGFFSGQRNTLVAADDLGGGIHSLTRPLFYGAPFH